MSDDFDGAVDTVLRRARAAAEPQPRQLARALDGVRLKLDESNGAGPGGLGVGAGSGLSKRTRAPGKSASRLGARLRFVSWSALSAAVGFWLGMQYTRGAPPFVAWQTPVPPAVASSALEAPRRVEERAPSPPGLLLTPSNPSTPPSSDGAELAPNLATTPPHAPPRETPTARTPSPRTPSSRGESTRAAERLSFRQVLDRLRRAERARSGGAPELALSVLDEIDLEADPGVLSEERLLTRVLSLCDQGDHAGARLRARALDAADTSIYASRLRESCITESEP